MLDFFKEYWTGILSIVGAAAWLPIILIPLINHFRKMQVTVLDSRILTNGKSTSSAGTEEINGTIILLAINLFIKDVTLFANKISMKVKLKNGTASNCEILDFSSLVSKNDNKTKSKFKVNIKDDFNISRTIHPNTDNIKYIAIIVKSATFSKLDEIDEIQLELFYRKIKSKVFSKKIVIKPSDFPNFNSTHLLNSVEEIIEER